MGRVIVIEFVTVDGVVQDPDGQEGFARGEGTRLFPGGTAPVDLHLASAETSGAAILLRYSVASG